MATDLEQLRKQVDHLSKWYDKEKAQITDKDHKISPSVWNHLASILSSELEIVKIAAILNLAEDIHAMRTALVRDEKDEQS